MPQLATRNTLLTSYSIDYLQENATLETPKISATSMNQAEMNHAQEATKAGTTGSESGAISGGSGTAAARLPTAHTDNIGAIRHFGTPGIIRGEHAAAARSAEGKPAGVGGDSEDDNSDDSEVQVASEASSPLIFPATQRLLSSETAGKLASMGIVAGSGRGQRLDFGTDDSDEDPFEVDVTEDQNEDDKEGGTKALAGGQMRPTSTVPPPALSSHAPAGYPTSVSPPSTAPATSSPAAADAVDSTYAALFVAWAQAALSNAAACNSANIAGPSPPPATSSPAVAAAVGNAVNAMLAGHVPATLSRAGAGDPAPLGASVPATPAPTAAVTAGATRASVYTGQLPAPSHPPATSSPGMVAAAGNTAAPVFTGQVPARSWYAAVGHPGPLAAHSPGTVSSSPAVTGAATNLHIAAPIRVEPASVSTPLPVSAPPAPASSPTVGGTAGSAGTAAVGVVKPNFDLWVLKDLRQESSR